MKNIYIAVFLIFSQALALPWAVARDEGENHKNNEGRLITLADGIKIVSQDSRLIKIAFADTQAAMQDLRVAFSPLLPQVTSLVTETWLVNQPAAKFGLLRVESADRQSLSAGVAVYQTLFDFGKSIADYKSAGEMLSGRQANLEIVRRAAVLEFILVYFDSLEAEKMVVVARNQVKSLTAFAADIENLYEAGTAVKNDLLPARVRLSDAKVKLISARNNRAIYAARFNNILALPLGEKVRIRDSRVEVAYLPGRDELWETAAAKRPEISFIAAQKKASAFREKSFRAQNRPKVFAEGGYSYAQNEYQVHQDNAYVNVGVKFNVFDGQLSQAQVSKEKYFQKQTDLQREKLAEDIKFEIESSLLNFNNALEKTKVSREALSQAQENVRVTRIKYNSGSATTTEVLEAVTLQTLAQTNYYDSQYDLKRNYARLMYAAGMDLSLINETWPKSSPKSVNSLNELTRPRHLWDGGGAD
jgi:outer membrane protein TolC